MASTPRANIADNTIQGLHCAICGEDTLQIVHIERLPDYVECSACKSAYIMEDGGERVLYGQIAEGYPQTSQFALKQWAWLEAVETRAHEERPITETDLPPTPETRQEEPPSIAPEPSPEVEPKEPGGVPSEWTAVDDVSPAEEPDDLVLEEFDSDYSAEAMQRFPEGPTSEELSEELREQQEQDTGLVDEVEDQVGYDVDFGAEEQAELEESDEMPGFAWLGGLADEDSALDGPDLPASDETPLGDDVSAEPMTPEAGLSAEDLDDLFMSDSADEEFVPSFDASVGELQAEPEEAVEDSSWSTIDSELPSMEADEAEESPDSWLDGIDVELDEPEEPTSSPDLEPQAEARIESQDELSWQAVDLPIEDEPVEEAPYDDWLRDAPGEESVESEPTSSDFEPSAMSYSIDEEDSDEDFLSSLRDSAAIPLESQPLEDHVLQEEEGEPSPPSWAIDEDQEEIGVMAARMQAVTSSAEAPIAEEALEEESSEQLPDEVEQETSEDDEIHYRESDPPPGYRHRVVVGGEHVVFPGGECVHCGRTPVKGQLAIAGTLPEGQGMGDRKPTRFQVPLCGECRDRATSLSEDAKSARLQSLLFALIVGMAFVVGALAFSLVNPGEMQLADWFILLILFIIGFAGSALLLLNRIGNYPPPMDAAYVRTTLLIPSETQGLETAFEWRNAEYAQRFYEANQSNTLGNVTQVKDRLILSRSV